MGKFIKLATAIALILAVAWAGQAVNAGVVATFVVTSGNMQGWGTFTVDGGFFKFAEGPGRPPLGKESFIATVDGNDMVGLQRYDYVNEPLNILFIDYATYHKGKPDNDWFINLYVKAGGDQTTANCRLDFNGATVSNRWNRKSPMTARGWTVHNYNPDAPGHMPCPYQHTDYGRPKTWREVLSEFRKRGFKPVIKPDGVFGTATISIAIGYPSRGAQGKDYIESAIDSIQINEFRWDFELNAP
ncbi:MAG: hypothetical protein CUN51_00455 [Candidatus Thermofonsia Clade 1 bacterium]|uniref:Uncharacterized protein n=1 Tax=Candidatus Thermofonsia Clade 1 bacterium TaxID=2364210 RepID=A0A2M8P3K7_9CHLR|nr:MAG: hypothetical protein CUN51_00455 [Candidatus Thermofonsia Clade 1 bacterium]